MIWTTWVNFDSASALAILILPYTVRFLYCHLLNMELTSPSFSSKLFMVRAGSAMRLIPRILSRDCRKCCQIVADTGRHRKGTGKGAYGGQT